VSGPVNPEPYPVPQMDSVSEGNVHLNPAMSSTSAKSGGGGERGAEMLEFALLFAALMTLMLGIVVFVRAYNIYQTMTRGAREGARMAVLPSAWNGGSGGSYIDSVSACTSPPTTTNSPDTTIFNDYIKPVLESANLSPSGVQNYQECEGWMDPAGTADNQCGVTVSFQYPYHMSIPFLGASLGTINIGTHVQMRREDQPMAVGGASALCAGQSEP